MGLNAVEVAMLLHEHNRMQNLAVQGALPIPRDVLGKDNTHQNPNYEAVDPFYSGPPIQKAGGSAMHFADVARPDLG